MTREHVVRLTVLTACIFAFSIYMQKGTWIFPFPLYEAALLPAVIALYVVDKKRPGITGILAIIWSLLQLCASQFVLEFFINDRNFEWFYESLITDYLLLFFVLILMVWGWVVSFGLGKILYRAMSWLAIAAFTACFILNAYYWAMLPLVVWLTVWIVAEREASIHRNILFLFTFFFLSKHLTLLFMGS